MKTAALLAVAMLALSTMLWASDDAVAAPQQGAMAAPISEKTASGTDAIAIPHMMTYQGMLTNASGVPVPNGNYRVAFRLYAAPAGGSPFWQETQSVTTRDGLFSVVLGSEMPIGGAPNADAAYLGMAVAGDAEMTPRLRVTGAVSAPSAVTDANDAWVRIGTDSVLYTIRRLGIAKGGASNKLYGIYGYTQVNLGSACTTGVSGKNYANTAIGGGSRNNAGADYATVPGGYRNTANGTAATVGGGHLNRASGSYATAGGGRENTATSDWTTVGGGIFNTNSGPWSVVAGGAANTASAYGATVGGGESDVASADAATVSGGYYNEASGVGATVGGGMVGSASGYAATVGGGEDNVASGDYATVPGGSGNEASGECATVPGGSDNIAEGDYSFAAGDGSEVPEDYDNSAAFNGEVVDDDYEVRCDVLHANDIVFALDDPLDPDGSIMNQFAVGSPEIVVTFRGSAVIGTEGRVVAELPRYFDALCRNPMVQLTGVGSSDVYVAADVAGNSFSIGGRPGTKVYWTVTGERKDQLAEITRIRMPVQKPRTGALVGRSISDASLVGSLPELQRLGLGGRYTFRTAAGKKRYEDMLKRRTESQRPDFKQHEDAYRKRLAEAPVPQEPQE